MVCHYDCGERERETRCIVSLYVCVQEGEVGLTLCVCVCVCVCLCAYVKRVHVEVII